MVLPLFTQSGYCVDLKGVLVGSTSDWLASPQVFILVVDTYR